MGFLLKSAIPALALGALLGLSAAAGAGDATVQVKAHVKYQTILGWGATASKLRIGDHLRDQVLDAAVNDLGLTRLRFEIPRREWEDVYNDDADPNHVNWAAFKTGETDERVRDVIGPFKKRVEANGEHFCLYVSPSFFDGGSTGSAPPWMLDNPAEYAEWAAAFLEYLKTKHDIVADYYSICNEAGNNNAFSPPVVAKMIKALGPRIKAMGLPTKIQFPECVNAAASWNYIQKLQNDSEMWSYVGLVTYHLYGSVKERPLIYDFAVKKGLPTGQTEFMGTTIHHLYEDLAVGGVSYWEHYGLAGPWGGNGTYLHTHLSGTSFWPYREYWNFRQIMHYVRPGAVRVEAASDEESLRALAFVRDEKTAVVLINVPPPVKDAPPAQDRSVLVKGLPAGKYGLCQSVPNKPYQELGVQTVAAEGELKAPLPKGAVLTIYPHAGTNLPPTVTEWKATPGYLTAPASRITLSAAATDPEKDALSYAWSVLGKPAGASVTLETPSAATTPAQGLTAPGDYLFEAAVSDPTHKVTRQVKLTVFPDNQPPILLDLHNRLPVTVVQPASKTTLCGAGLDLENDPLTYQWSLVSQPAGAAATLETPDKNRCVVSGLTAAGQYVFKFEVKDRTHTVSMNLAVTVHPPLPRTGVRAGL